MHSDQSVSRRHLVVVYGILAVIVGFYAVSALKFPMAFIWATYEDLIGEWAQVWALVLAMVGSVALARRRGPFRYRWFFGFLAVACFYVVMEEISWGQRLIGFASPEYFRQRNLQNETNLHNFLTGPYSTALKAAISYGLAIALVAYGLVLPVGLRRQWAWARRLDAWGVASPPVYLWPYFCLAGVLEVGWFRFNEGEIAEILIDLAMALTVAQYRVAIGWSSGSAAGGLESGGPVEATGDAGRSLVMRLAIRFGQVVLIVLVLSVGTTAAVYASDAGRKRIENRIGNGVEKFAGRYARYHRWATAAELYFKTLQAEPRRMSVIRKLANCYKQLGDEGRFYVFLDRALALDRARLKKRPGSAAVHRSLARTYRMLGETQRADKHLTVALRNARRRVARAPDDPGAAYSLGRTYRMLGQHEAALEQIARAYRLKPTSRKYRKAYFAAKRAVR